jgi:hypothetical protein
MTGSVGLAGSANIGETSSSLKRFTAARRAAPDKTKPIRPGLFLGAIMMLIHIKPAGHRHARGTRLAQDDCRTAFTHTTYARRRQHPNKPSGNKNFADEVANGSDKNRKTFKSRSNIKSFEQFRRKGDQTALQASRAGEIGFGRRGRFHSLVERQILRLG